MHGTSHAVPPIKFQRIKQSFEPNLRTNNLQINLQIQALSYCRIFVIKYYIRFTGQHNWSKFYVEEIL